MNWVHPQSLNLFEREAGELHPLPVEVVHVAAGGSREDLLGHRFGHEPKPLTRFLGIAKRFFAVAKRRSEIVVPRD